MDNYIFDGEPHALSKDYGYIAKRIHEAAHTYNLCEHVHEHLIKYCEYLYLNDKEEVINYLMDIFKHQVFIGSTDENFQLIFQPPYMVSCLDQFATLSLKFKRAEKDNLVTEDE